MGKYGPERVKIDQVKEQALFYKTLGNLGKMHTIGNISYPKPKYYNCNFKKEYKNLNGGK
jgi:hypothetical protein